MKTLIFDFDGTIVDSFGITIEAYNKVAPEIGSLQILDNDFDLIRSLSANELMKRYKVRKSQLLKLALAVRTELKDKIIHARPHSGLSDVVRELKRSGTSLGIMTSNSKDNVVKFLEVYNLTNEFDFIYSGKNVLGKHRVLKNILKRHGLKKEEAMYVGDETRDIRAAKKAGISGVAVTWGFNSAEALKKEQPDFIAESPEDLLNYSEM